MNYDYLFSLENIYIAWRRFRSGKAGKKDVMVFEYNLAENLLGLYKDLSIGNYCHGNYDYFQVFDPKKRDIYKAIIRDRVVHQIIFDYLSNIYEPVFIANSYASRLGKGTHRAVGKLQYFIKKTMANNHQSWILKGDVRKYFASIDKTVLFELISRQITDLKILEVIKKIIFSFKPELPGIPLGNITSQIFANIYLHEMDCLIKYKLGVNEYIRYNDDLAIVGNSEKKLVELSDKIVSWLKNELKLDLPPEKIIIRKANWGIDFLGYMVFPGYIILRPKTKYRLLKRINRRNLSSYLGLLSHCQSYNLKQKILNLTSALY